jgi:hypothetical protein
VLKGVTFLVFSTQVNKSIGCIVQGAKLSGTVKKGGGGRKREEGRKLDRNQGKETEEIGKETGEKIRKGDREGSRGRDRGRGLEMDTVQGKERRQEREDDRKGKKTRKEDKE